METLIARDELVRKGERKPTFLCSSHVPLRRQPWRLVYITSINSTSITKTHDSLNYEDHEEEPSWSARRSWAPSRMHGAKIVWPIVGPSPCRAASSSLISFPCLSPSINPSCWFAPFSPRGSSFVLSSCLHVCHDASYPQSTRAPPVLATWGHLSCVHVDSELTGSCSKKNIHARRLSDTT